jgi:hypothetical protein
MGELIESPRYAEYRPLSDGERLSRQVIIWTASLAVFNAVDETGIRPRNIARVVSTVAHCDVQLVEPAIADLEAAGGLVMDRRRGGNGICLRARSNVSLLPKAGNLIYDYG